VTEIFYKIFHIEVRGESTLFVPNGLDLEPTGDRTVHPFLVESFQLKSKGPYCCFSERQKESEKKKYMGCAPSKTYKTRRILMKGETTSAEEVAYEDKYCPEERGSIGDLEELVESDFITDSQYSSADEPEGDTEIIYAKIAQRRLENIRVLEVPPGDLTMQTFCRIGRWLDGVATTVLVTDEMLMFGVSEQLTKRNLDRHDILSQSRSKSHRSKSQ